MRYFKHILFLLCIITSIGTPKAQTRDVITLKKGWKFNKVNHPEALKSNFDDSHWEDVSVPHDWAIYGPFDKDIDKQVVAIEQNAEEVASEKTGRTGALLRRGPRGPSARQPGSSRAT